MLTLEAFLAEQVAFLASLVAHQAALGEFLKQNKKIVDRNYVMLLLTS